MGLRLQKEEHEVYKFKDRKVPYRSETLEISEKEKVLLDKWLRESCGQQQEEMVCRDTIKPVPVIMDTSIGTDIDDCLALLLALRLPPEDIRLLGITTVYGDTTLRTAIGQKIIDAYKLNQEIDIPVIRGEGVPIGTHRPIYQTGIEGIPLFSQEELLKIREEHHKWIRSKKRRHEAAKFIIEQAYKYPGDLQLVCVGALTNVAWAIKLDPKIIPNIRKITFMGIGKRWFPPASAYKSGIVYSFCPNHNVSSDTMASYKVFQSGIPIDVINETVGNQLWFGLVPQQKWIDGNPLEELIKRKKESPPDISLVVELMEVWLSYRSKLFGQDIKGTCPHNALALVEAVYEDKFVKFVRGNIIIHEWAGFSSFVMNPNGVHRIGCAVNAEEFLNYFTKKIMPHFDLPVDFFRLVLKFKENKNLLED
jgi:inosine-uridine nucleoside N-ribohydrolase